MNPAAELPWSAMDPLGHSSFSFYNFMPGAGYQVAGSPPKEQVEQRINALTGTELTQAPEHALDELCALLLTHGHQLQLDAKAAQLADQSANCFAHLIADESRRAQRMRLTRLTLMLRTVLDRGCDTGGVISESVLPHQSPWDSIDLGANANWLIHSGPGDNLRLSIDGHPTWSSRQGLPTQLDALGPRELWVGSHYSNGGCLIHDADTAQPKIEPVAHDAPLVLMFEHDRSRWALDAQGRLWRVLQRGPLDPCTLQHHSNLAIQRVHRARTLGGTLFAFDWGEPEFGLRMPLHDFKPTRFEHTPVIVCNDICVHRDNLYAICKLQGKVFKFDGAGHFISAQLGAGLGAGCLLDPITIRSDGEHLLIINWFSGKVVRLRHF